MGPTSDIQPKTPADLAANLHAPLLGLYAGKDAGIDLADVQAAAAKARAAGQTVEIVVYPDAPHGFHADYRPSYRAAEAADGWQRMLAWFRSYLLA
jgi:carboxymethylenebutenolidase